MKQKPDRIGFRAGLPGGRTKIALCQSLNGNQLKQDSNEDDDDDDSHDLEGGDDDENDDDGDQDDDGTMRTIVIYLTCVKRVLIENGRPLLDGTKRVARERNHLSAVVVIVVIFVIAVIFVIVVTVIIVVVVIVVTGVFIVVPGSSVRLFSAF